MKRFIFAAALGAAACSALSSTGCATSQPQPPVATERTHTPTYAERLPYLDSKGRYQMDKALHDHPDWEVNWGG
jgi:hypothetical protein